MPDFRIGTRWTMTRTEARAVAKGLAAADTARSPRIRGFAIPPFPAMREVGALLAHEPVRAIGVNGIPATSDHADARIAGTQDVLGRRGQCLYGGLVKPGNCQGLMACPHGGGLVIGRSALGGPRLSRHSGALRRNHRRREMKLAIAGDSAGEGLAKVLADHRRGKHEVSEISPGARVIGPDLAIADAWLARTGHLDAAGRSAGNVDAKHNRS